METAPHDETGTIGSDAWLANMKDVMVGALARLQNPPPPSPPLEAAAHASLKHLLQIEQELKKGDAASPIVAANADRLRALYHDRLRVLGRLDEALLRRADDDGLYAALSALDSPALQPSATKPFGAIASGLPASHGAAAPAPVAPPVDETASAGASVRADPASNSVASTFPTFKEISSQYIAMRIDADGEDHKDIQYLRLRRQTFMDLIVDRPVDRYTGKDLQDYVSAMQFWPANVTKRAEAKGLSVRQILELNKDKHLAPLTKKTMQDGYLANVKTMIRSGMTTYGYHDPFAGVRLHWPPGYAPSVPREGIDDDVLNGTFRLGVDSGLLDNAILPLLAALTTRRIGLLCFLQGKDIRRKHGVWIAQTAGIVFADGAWHRVPTKTAASGTFFVLHEKLSEIGFVDWARQQPGYIFEAIHEYKDPAKSTSKNLNQLMRDAGARGGVEVLHSLRGDGIDEMRDQEIDGRDRRLQAGHAVGNDEHDQYGFRALSAVACRRLAKAKVAREIDWKIFKNLDFDKLAAKRRRPK